MCALKGDETAEKHSDDALWAALGPVPRNTRQWDAELMPLPAPPIPDSFAASLGAAPLPPAHHACHLLLLTANLSLGAARLGAALRPTELAFLVVAAAICATAAVWALVNPSAYSRHRTPIAICLHLLLPASLLFVDAARALSVTHSHEANGGEGTGGSDKALGRGVVALALLSVSGTLSLLHVSAAFTLRLPPVLAACLQAMGLVAAVSTNARTCTSGFLRHQAVRSRLASWYRFLEPAIALLGPLSPKAPGAATAEDFRCRCVLAALQFWLGCALPQLLLSRHSVLKYAAWRLRKRQAERAARRRPRTLPPWELGLLSDGNVSAASGANGTLSGWAAPPPRPPPAVAAAGLPPAMLVALPPRLLQKIHAFNAARRERRAERRARDHHQDDWQYAAAEAVLGVLQPTPRNLLIACTVITHLYGLHLMIAPYGQ